MSSDDYFKTICVANKYYNAQTVISSSGTFISNTIIYEFIPSGDLFCNRNYPPGYMELASPALITAIQEDLVVLCFVTWEKQCMRQYRMQQMHLLPIFEWFN